MTLAVMREGSWREQDPPPEHRVQELVARARAVVSSLAREPSHIQVKLLTSLSNLPTLPAPKTEK